MFWLWVKESQKTFLHFLRNVHPESVGYNFQTSRCKTMVVNANLSFSYLICILAFDHRLNVPEGSCLIYVFNAVCPYNEYATLLMVDLIHRDHKTFKVGSHHPFLENFCVYDEKCWCSYNSIFASNYFLMDSEENLLTLFWESHCSKAHLFCENILLDRAWEN